MISSSWAENSLCWYETRMGAHTRLSRDGQQHGTQQFSCGRASCSTWAPLSSRAGNEKRNQMNNPRQLGACPNKREAVWPAWIASKIFSTSPKHLSYICVATRPSYLCPLGLRGSEFILFRRNQIDFVQNVLIRSLVFLALSLPLSS